LPTVVARHIWKSWHTPYGKRWINSFRKDKSMKTLALALVVGCVCCTGRADAQTSSLKATWNMSDAPTVAQSYTYTLKDNGTAVPLGTVTCALVGTATNCSAPLSGALPTATSHTLVLTAANAFGSTDSAPTTGSKPGQPTGFTITITVTVQGAP
jgi:hypothetical protein